MRTLFVGDMLRCKDRKNFMIVCRAPNGGMIGLSHTFGYVTTRLFNDDATTASSESWMQVIEHIAPNIDIAA